MAKVHVGEDGEVVVANDIEHGLARGRVLQRLEILVHPHQLAHEHPGDAVENPQVPELMQVEGDVVQRLADFLLSMCS